MIAVPDQCTIFTCSFFAPGKSSPRDFGIREQFCFTFGNVLDP